MPIDHLDKRDGVYMKQTQTSEVSTHVHLVKFDELGSDGTSVGWNYVQAAMPGQTYAYRWFVDQPLRTVFFHDHQYANLHQQKGLFAAMNVEPKDATWHDPKTGNATDGVGPVADIGSPSGPDFREFSGLPPGPRADVAEGRAADRPAVGARRLRRGPGWPGHQLPQRAVPDPHLARRGGGEGRSGLRVLLGGPRRPVDAGVPAYRRTRS